MSEPCLVCGRSNADMAALIAENEQLWAEKAELCDAFEDLMKECAHYCRALQFIANVAEPVPGCNKCREYQRIARQVLEPEEAHE